MTSASWIDAARQRDVLEVATRLGFKSMPARGASGGSFGPCPSCSALQRHPSRRDRRLACGVRADGGGWRCYECDASGDAIDLVAWRLGDARYRDLSEQRRGDVRAWFGGESASLPAPRVARVVAPAPTFPAAGELAEVWAACGSVLGDAETSAMLLRRRIDPVHVADRDLGRALPRGATVPGWARIAGQWWPESGHRLLVPLFDAHGVMRSIIARRVTDGTGDAPKSIAPTGCSRAGLVMADALGRRLLESGATPAWWSARGPRLEVWIAEGEIDFLTCAAGWPAEHEQCPATFGIASGSWTADVAARVPNEARVVIATDHDEQGEKYCAAIVASLLPRERIEIARWEPTATTGAA